jgi:hypothetical protein
MCTATVEREDQLARRDVGAPEGNIQITYLHQTIKMRTRRRVRPQTPGMCWLHHLSRDAYTRAGIYGGRIIHGSGGGRDKLFAGGL